MMNSILCKKVIYNILIIIASVFTICFVIELLSIERGNELVFPSIFTIFKRFFIVLGESKTYQAFGNTMIRLIIAIIVSFIIGGCLGIIGGSNKYFGLFMKPIMTFARSIPIIVLVIIILVTTKTKYIPVLSASFVLTPIVYEQFYRGVKSLDKSYMDVWMLSSGLNLMVIRKVHLPLISPYIRSAIINSLSMGIKVLITTEYLAGSSVGISLGRLIVNSKLYKEFDYLYAYAICITIIILIFEYVPVLLFKLYEYNKYREHKK